MQWIHKHMHSFDWEEIKMNTLRDQRKIIPNCFQSIKRTEQSNRYYSLSYKNFIT